MQGTEKPTKCIGHFALEQGSQVARYGGIAKE